VGRSAPDVEVHLVNPAYDAIDGRPCVAGLDDIDGPVDLVLLGVRDSAVEEQLSRAAARGDRGAVVFGSLVEPGRPDGPALRARVAATAREAGMALCGGGCMGFVNVARGVRAIGYVERHPLPAGPVAVVTHSGSVFSALLRTRRHLGFTVVVSSGQELVTPAAAYLDYALGLEETRVVGLVLETLRAPVAMRAALERAAGQDVTVVALTVGGSPRGRAMVAAHSGALAGDDGGWEALFEAYGVVRVGDLDELGDTLELFAAGRRVVRSGPGGGIATVHDSGAERALVVDIASQVGIPFAAIGDDTRSSLSGLLDTGLVPDNPLDVWGTGADTEDLLAGSLTALAADRRVEAVALAVDLVAEYDGDLSYPAAVLRAAAGTTKPVAVLANLGSAIDGATADRVRAGGVPVLEGTRSGLLALGHLLARPTGEGTPPPVAPPTDDARRRRWCGRLARGPLSADEAFALLEAYGIPTVPARTVRSPDQAVRAAGELGYPVVLKTASPGVAHKSDLGGVVLGVADADSVAAVYRDLAARLGPEVTVAATASEGVELALGLVRDPQLGPLVVIGAGGVLVEVLADRVVRLPPLDARRAGEALGRLRLAPLLDGLRGRPPVDRAAVARAVVGLSTLALELGGSLEALDVNPLRCGPEGCVALDALVVVAPPPG
jgi:acyl-CoA synthetase (NDP forming)